MTLPIHHVPANGDHLKLEEARSRIHVYVPSGSPSLEVDIEGFVFGYRVLTNRKRKSGCGNLYVISSQTPPGAGISRPRYRAIGGRRHCSSSNRPSNGSNKSLRAVKRLPRPVDGIAGQSQKRYCTAAVTARTFPVRAKFVGM